ncbi:MAG: hypothetical protein HQ528_00435 [Candidatus Marinimicrobia bacterium]|nr:hypothetical protein [Candidatus Neomarinimicrobiota bacterium]
MTIRIIESKISLEELRTLCQKTFKYFVKFVADIDQGLIAIGGELHADGEELLLESGSRQDNLWGVNFYSENDPDDRVEYESFINIRPRLDNNSMKVENESIRIRIRQLAEQLILAPGEKVVLPK